MSTEEWRRVAVDDRYEVSSHGRVRSYCRPGPPRLRKLPPDAYGYPLVMIGGKNLKVHRLVARAFIGECPPGYQVRHLDGNPANAHLSNLAYGTASENALDKRRHGTDQWVNKTHCPSGHPYDEANTYVLPSRPNARYCIKCVRAASKASMARARARRREANQGSAA